ncbi:MAG: tetratricopeptide repeat protein [Pirellula sp.]
MLLALLIFGGVLLVNRWQKANLAASLLKRSLELQSKQEWSEALVYLEMYLKFHEGDLPKRVELLESYNQQPLDLLGIRAIVPQYLAVVGLCESNPSLVSKVPGLRRALIQRQLELGDCEGALQQIAKLAGPEEDPSIERLLALCRFRLASEQRVDRWDNQAISQVQEWLWDLGAMHPVDLLLRSLSHTRGDPDLALAFASLVLEDPKLLQKSQIAGESDTALRQRLRDTLDPILELHGDDPKAWLTYFAILSQLDPEQAAVSVKTSIERFPENDRILKAASQFHLERAQAALANGQSEVRERELKTAEELLERVRRSSDPRQAMDASVFAVLGDIQLERGSKEKALDIWSEGIDKGMPPTTLLHFRKVKLLINRGSPSEALAELEKMDQSLRKESILFNVSTMETLNRTARQLWATYYISQEDYVSVSKVLDEAAAQGSENRAVGQIEILAALGKACLFNNQWDRAGVAYERAIELAPDNSDYRRGAAQAWYRANRLRDALKHWQAISNKSRQDWFQIATVALELQMRSVPEPVRWEVFDQAIAQVLHHPDPSDSTSVEPWQVELLELKSRVARMPEAATEAQLPTICNRVSELCESIPNNQEAWIQSSLLLQSWNRSEDAVRLMEQFVKNNPESTLAIVQRARIAAAQNQIEVATELLAAQLEKTPDDEDLLRELFRIPRSQEARSALVERLSKWSGKDGMRLKRLGDWLVRQPVLTSEDGDDVTPELRKTRLEAWAAPIEAIEKRMRAIEGERGSEWRWLMARRLLAQSDLDDRIKLEPVTEIARFLKSDRPQWSYTYVLEGMLAEKRSDLRSAILAYEKALSLGEDNPMVYERLIDALWNDGMQDQAKEMIRRLGAQAMRSNRIATMAMELASQDDMSLVRLAKARADGRPLDPISWVWYAQALAMRARSLSVQERSADWLLIDNAFLRAAKLSKEQDTRVHKAAFEFYAATGQLEKIDGWLKRIESDNAVSADLRSLILAIAAQSRGNLELAESHYRVALRSGPTRRENTLAFGSLLLQRGELNEAIQVIEALHESLPKDVEVREALAVALALRGSKSDWDQLQSVLLSPQGANTLEDRRTLAKLLMQRGLPSDLMQARSMLEVATFDPKRRAAEDAFVLATVYTTLANRLENTPGEEEQTTELNRLAEYQLNQIVTDSAAKPEYLLAYGDFLLTRNRPEKANEISQRLSAAYPASADAMLLRARVFHALNKQTAGVQFVKDWLIAQQRSLPSNGDEARESEVLANAARAFFTLHAMPEATPIVQYVSQKNPALAEALLFSLAQSNDPVVRDLAFDRLLEACQPNPSRLAANRLLQLLATGALQGDRMQRAVAVLDQFAVDHPDDADFCIRFADHWIRVQDLPHAIGLLQQALERAPKNVTALNNLANLLAETPERSNEALEVIDRAIEVAGPHPNLLDSKGCILVQAKRFDEAVPILQQAANNGFDPRFKLHWFMALQGAGKKQEANQVRREIDTQALSATFLSPMDQAALEQLRK